MKRFNFSFPANGNGTAKNSFHATARARFRALAKLLDLPEGSFDIRTNKAGPAVSGETTLHGDQIYIQVSQGFMGPSILIRRCKGRKDYSGGMNYFRHANDLNDLTKLRAFVFDLLARQHH